MTSSRGDTVGRAVEALGGLLDDEERARPHALVSLVGAHARGYAGPGAPVEVAALHLGPSERVERHAQLEGATVVYRAEGLRAALGRLLDGDVGTLACVLGPLVLREAPLAEELRVLARGAFSRRMWVSARDAALAARARFVASREVVPLLDALAAAWGGTRLLLDGTFDVDVMLVAPADQAAGAEALAAAARADHAARLAREARDEWLFTIDLALTALDRARDRAVVPEEPANGAAIAAWLDVRGV